MIELIYNLPYVLLCKNTGLDENDLPAPHLGYQQS